MTTTIGRTPALAPASFDVCGALPTGTTVLEASAGTGKTFTIAALAARYVAEGHATLPELMLVTFGREASQELRERVRERLVSAERGLAEPAAARTGGDEVLRLLADAPDAEVAVRRGRLAGALTQFDAATIATTHQFCQQMLAGLGVAGDGDPDAVFAESIDDMVTEVVDDFYVRKYGAHSAGTPAFSRSEALALARRAVHDGQARLEPVDAAPGSTAQVRHRFAAAVRSEVARRSRVAERPLDRAEPLPHPFAQLLGGLAAERDQHQLGQLGVPLRHVADGERRDRERLAGTRARLEDGGAGRQLTAHVERGDGEEGRHRRTRSSARISGSHSRSASVPNSVGSPPFELRSPNTMLASARSPHTRRCAASACSAPAPALQARFASSSASSGPPPERRTFA